jgi:heparosan-N-sulfate-glucuronate 5-epimerase
MVSRLTFYLKKAYRDLVDPKRFGISDDYPNNPDWPYALDYSATGMVKLYDMRRDRDGIVMMPHYIDHVDKTDDTESHYYSPLKIAHYALGVYNDHLKGGREPTLQEFFDHVDHLAENHSCLNQDPDLVVWRTPTSVVRYEVGVNHVSAIVQGLVISALVRAYLLTNDAYYVELADRALGVLDVPVAEGGVRAESQWGVAYEEYPSTPYSHVINGFIFCLIGLFELSVIADSDRAQKLFDQGVNTLAQMIPVWIDDWWSKYDLRDTTNGEIINYATNHYQYLHIDQLKIIYKITGEKRFEMGASKMTDQIDGRVGALIAYLYKFRKLILNRL